MKPGIYYDMPFEEYAAIDAVNCSKLVSFDKTPAHCLIEKSDTPGMCRGRIIHAAINEPERYEKEVGFMPKGMRRKGPQFEAWKAEHPEAKELGHEQDKEAVDGIVASLKSGYYETARKLIEICDKSEVVLVWIDQRTGCLCKCRLDLMNEELGLIVDLKSSTTSDAEQWMRTAANTGQPHWQAAHYLDGAREVLGRHFSFDWILCETKPPYGIQVIRAYPTPEGEQDLIYLANTEMVPVLDRYLECKKQNRFPGRPDQVVYARFPQWRLNKIKEDY